MSVRDVSARTPAGIREESARSPLYPTRPDPYPSRTVSSHLHLLVDHQIQIVQ